MSYSRKEETIESSEKKNYVKNMLPVFPLDKKKKIVSYLYKTQPNCISFNNGMTLVDFDLIQSSFIIDQIYEMSSQKKEQTLESHNDRTNEQTLHHSL